MMKINLPEPFAAFQRNHGWSGNYEEVFKPSIGRDGVVAAFTTEQMEAYAQAKVNEALEMAAIEIDQAAERCYAHSSGINSPATALSAASRHVRYMVSNG